MFELHFHKTEVLKIENGVANALYRLQEQFPIGSEPWNKYREDILAIYANMEILKILS